MNLNDDVVYCCLRLEAVRQRHRAASPGLDRHHNRLNLRPPCVVKLQIDGEQARLELARIRCALTWLARWWGEMEENTMVDQEILASQLKADRPPSRTRETSPSRSATQI